MEVKSWLASETSLAKEVLRELERSPRRFETWLNWVARVWALSNRTWRSASEAGSVARLWKLLNRSPMDAASAAPPPTPCEAAVLSALLAWLFNCSPRLAWTDWRDRKSVV